MTTMMKHGVVRGCLLLLCTTLPARFLHGFQQFSSTSRAACSRQCGPLVGAPRRAFDCFNLPTPTTTARSSCRLSLSSNENNDINESSLDIAPLLVFGGIPLLSLGLALLLQFRFLAPLVICKRLYIYALALLVVMIGSTRGATDDAALGTRLVDLTRQVLPPNVEKIQDKQDDTRFQEMATELDRVEDSTQAVGLPLLVVASFATSVLIFLFQQQQDNLVLSSPSIALLESIKELIPSFSLLTNGLVVSLFCRAELARLPILQQNEILTTLIALILSALAFAGPSALVWPIQNILCVCLAIAVARAIQLPRMGPILVALTGLVLYDVVSVGIQLIDLGSASLAQSQTVSSSSASSSAMGAVALAKTTGEAMWQPGLFVVRLRGIVTDLLGLGDSVFPCLLSTLCLRFDQEQKGSNCFVASLLGFATGCFACEFVPGVSSSGLPALLFIVPSMLAFVGGTVTVQGNFARLFAFDAGTTSKSTALDE